MISFSLSGISETKRGPKMRNKGRSYIDFPEEYCIVDIETTGLNPNYDEIIEIGVVKYSNGEVVGTFETLVKPSLQCDEDEDEEEYYYYVDEYITDLTGITNEMLETAPNPEEAIMLFDEFLEDSIIVGYNVNFDVNFLYDAFEKYLEKPLVNDYIDLLRIARKLYPELSHHRLRDMIEHLEIDVEQEHRALSDCEITQECYQNFYEEALNQYGNIEDFLNTFTTNTNIKLSEIKGDASKLDTNSVLYNKCCVFTGKLEQYTRKEAMQIVADLGGINENTVTKKTHFLVLGNNDYNASLKGGKSSKHKKAESYKAAGQDIEIVSERAFYEYINESLKRSN